MQQPAHIIISTVPIYFYNPAILITIHFLNFQFEIKQANNLKSELIVSNTNNKKKKYIVNNCIYRMKNNIMSICVISWCGVKFTLFYYIESKI